MTSAFSVLWRVFREHRPHLLAVAAVVDLAFLTLVCVTPLDNVVELPHAVLSALNGLPDPFGSWKSTYDFETRAPEALGKNGLDLAALPPLSNLIEFPVNDEGRRLLVVVFVLLQATFAIAAFTRPTRRMRRVVVPVCAVTFGVFSAALIVGLLLVFLDFAAVLQSVDSFLKPFADETGWTGLLFGSWSAAALGFDRQYNRPWVFSLIVLLATPLAVGSAYRLRARDFRRIIARMLLLLLTMSSLIAFLGFCIDTAVRSRLTDTFMSGSFVAILFALPMAIWAALPLVIGLQAFGPPREDRHPASPATSDPDRFIATARSMCLALLATSLVALEVGRLHSARVRLLTESRNLVSLQWIEEKWLNEQPGSRECAPPAPRISGQFAYGAQRVESLDYCTPDAEVLEVLARGYSLPFRFISERRVDGQGSISWRQWLPIGVGRVAARDHRLRSHPDDSQSLATGPFARGR